MTTRVFISVDMEGVAGVATLDQIIRGGTGYPRAQELMTAETNAAIRGAFAGGADEVVVNDSHGTMDNLPSKAVAVPRPWWSGCARPPSQQ